MNNEKRAVGGCEKEAASVMSLDQNFHVVRGLAVKQAATASSGESVRYNYPLEFLRDYLTSVTQIQRRHRLNLSLLGYLIYVMIVFLLYFAGTEPSKVYDLEQVADGLARPESDEWQKMESLGDFWNWFETIVLPQYYKENWYTVTGSTGATTVRDFQSSDALGNLHMYRYNLIAGAMRIKQKRVNTDSCTIAEEMARDGEYCYAYLNSGTESKADFTGSYSNRTYTFTESIGGEWYGSVPGQWHQ